jgi:hypothetical protein
MIWGLHLQEKSIECAGTTFDKTNSFILEVMAEYSKSPTVWKREKVVVKE